MGNIPKKVRTEGEVAEFVISDWVAIGGRYVLDVVHGLESINVSAKLWENLVSEIFVDRIEIVNTNTIRLYTSIDPDCRFDGKIIVTKI